jgi:hypothetical protein
MQEGNTTNPGDAGNSQDGSFEVRNGCVKIYDPIGGGSPAVILPDPYSIIKVNGKRIVTPQKVFTVDKIEVIPQVEEIPGKVEVALDKKQFLARMKITPHLTINKKLKEMPRQFKKNFDYEEEKTLENRITLTEARHALNGAGVIFGIDFAAVEKVLLEADGGWHEVARGNEVKKGRDGSIEPLFEPEITVSFAGGEESSKVDFKEKVTIPFVREGDIIAKIHHPELGEPGRLVTGAAIEPPPVKGARFYCKDGCELDKDGISILATKAGRPMVEGGSQKRFFILPSFIHWGDVDLKSGNLRFNGELKITGNIVEGMTVESQGNLEIQGHAAGARIIAGKSAIFKNNLINSHVTAGGLKNFYTDILPGLLEIEEFFVALFQSFEQLKRKLSEEGRNIPKEQTGQLLQLLAERKNENLLQLTADVDKMIGEAIVWVPNQLLTAVKKASETIQGKFEQIKSEQQFEQILQEVISARSFVEENMAVKGDVIALYVQNSRIETSGQITITGTGCYNSCFYTDDAVHIEGVFRGGRIRAQKNIFIGEAGSSGLLMKQGEIQLAADSEARFRKVYENIIIHFGKRVFKFENDRDMVKVFYDKKDDMIRIVNLV